MIDQNIGQTLTKMGYKFSLIPGNDEAMQHNSGNSNQK